MRGVISNLIQERGFGFVRADDQEFFFHRNALQGGTDFGDLAEGIAVEFEVGDEHGDEHGEKPRAVNVRLADDAIPAVDHEVLPKEKVV